MRGSEAVLLVYGQIWRRENYGDEVSFFGDEASFEINREELSSVEQEETIDQMGIKVSCESHADMSDPALYIHSMEKLDLATRKRFISQGAFQPKAHEMNEKRFPCIKMWFS